MGEFDLTVGTLMVGIVFNTFLFGLVTFQFAAYYRRQFNDPPVIKAMILFLFILDTVHSASVIYMLWGYTVTNYNNPSALAIGMWPYMWTPIATCLAAIVTQTFLGYRIYRLSKNIYLYIFIMTAAVPGFVLGFIAGVRAMIIKVFADLVVLSPVVIGWLSLQVVSDVMITISLIIILSRSRTGFRKTDTVLNKLIRGAVQTGLFAGIFSIGDLICFLKVPQTNLYGMFAIPIGRIYTNTLLDTLLTRDELRDKLSQVADMDSTQNRSGSRWGGNSRQNPQAIQLTEVEVSKDVMVFDDGKHPKQYDMSSSKTSVSMA
ncbi:hypothetical protein QCA50_004916 [Cerrena zonata]|uniref:DUF6534 domain-containing protein n=1 Tax=Cerrena zonata TaxID=2478898 RepID=A0AAW0GI90_9APHY